MGSQSGVTCQKSERFSGGFTLIEVILFLAISGLLLAGALAGISTNINNSRFNDAIRSTTSYLQSQYSEVAAGKSDRDALKGCDAGVINTTTRPLGMTDCVIMGRYIKLQGSSLTVRYIIGYRSTLLGISADDTAAVMQMSPRVAGADAYQSQYDVPWDIGLVKTVLWNGDSTATGFAIIRSPTSGNILYYAASNLTSPEPLLDSSFIKPENLNKDAVLCFADDGSSRTGRINIRNGRGQEVIQTDLATQGACS